ncbi:hypothetical protein [Paracoccus albus]|nr:hypothetical protein [Paracoccus albus]WBU59238.1 hypothetical protein PAF20_10620 [Paracoccus albus]
MTDGKDAETRKDDLRTGKPYWLTTSGISVRHRADGRGTDVTGAVGPDH